MEAAEDALVSDKPGVEGNKYWRATWMSNRNRERIQNWTVYATAGQDCSSTRMAHKIKEKLCILLEKHIS